MLNLPVSEDTGIGRLEFFRIQTHPRSAPISRYVAIEESCNTRQIDGRKYISKIKSRLEIMLIIIFLV